MNSSNSNHLQILHNQNDLTRQCICIEAAILFKFGQLHGLVPTTRLQWRLRTNIGLAVLGPSSSNPNETRPNYRQLAETRLSPPCEWECDAPNNLRNA